MRVYTKIDINFAVHFLMSNKLYIQYLDLYNSKVEKTSINIMVN